MRLKFCPNFFCIGFCAKFPPVKPPPPLSRHLAEFETTTASWLRAKEALALLNFTVLFNEEAYLSDTAVGDNRLIIENYLSDPYSGLYRQIRELIEAKILKVHLRDKVIVAQKTLCACDPGIQEVFEGWEYRDKNYWNGQVGFTTVVESRARRAYNRQIDELLIRNNAIRRYSHDAVKDNFRQRIRDVMARNGGSTLSRFVSSLPEAIQHKYHETLKEERFTYAELWRLIKDVKEAEQCIFLHAHVNEQCFADLTGSGLACREPGEVPIASFNLELERCSPWQDGADATMEPPTSLKELFEKAPVHLPPLGVELLSKLSVDQILSIRCHAARHFALSKTPISINRQPSIEDEYLVSLTKYWHEIIFELQRLFPDQCTRHGNAALFLERHLPSLNRLNRQFGRSIMAIVLRIKFPIIAPVARAIANKVYQAGFVLLSETPNEMLHLQMAVPPIPWSTRALLALDSKVPTEDKTLET